MSEFEDLIARVGAGDREAVAVLYEQFGPQVRAAVRAKLPEPLRVLYDSLDFTQDVWSSFLSAPMDRLSFPEPAALTAYLSRVARNKVEDLSRRRLKTRAGRAEIVNRSAEPDLAAGTEPTPSQHAIADEEWQRLAEGLPEGHRAILALLRDGYTTEEIAGRVGLHPGSVRRVVNRLRAKVGWANDAGN